GFVPQQRHPSFGSDTGHRILVELIAIGWMWSQIAIFFPPGHREPNQHGLQTLPLLGCKATAIALMTGMTGETAVQGAEAVEGSIEGGSDHPGALKYRASVDECVPVPGTESGEGLAVGIAGCVGDGALQSHRVDTDTGCGSEPCDAGNADGQQT